MGWLSLLAGQAVSGPTLTPSLAGLQGAIRTMPGLTMNAVKRIVIAGKREDARW